MNEEIEKLVRLAKDYEAAYCSKDFDFCGISASLNGEPPRVNMFSGESMAKLFPEAEEQTVNGRKELRVIRDGVEFYVRL